MVPPTPPPWVALFSSPTGGIASQFKSITYRCDGPEESIILSRGNFFAVRSYIQSGGWFYSRKLDSSWGALDSRFSKRSGFLQIHKSAPILTGIIEKTNRMNLIVPFCRPPRQLPWRGFSMDTFQVPKYWVFLSICHSLTFSLPIPYQVLLTSHTWPRCPPDSGHRWILQTKGYWEKDLSKHHRSPVESCRITIVFLP